MARRTLRSQPKLSLGCLDVSDPWLTSGLLFSATEQLSHRKEAHQHINNWRYMILFIMHIAFEADHS